MADLNAGLILEGVDTTHPVMAIPEGQQLQQAADTVQTQAATQQTRATTGLTNLQAQSVAIQNQQAADQLKASQLFSQAMANRARQVHAGQTVSPTTAATDTAAGTPAAAPAAGSVLPNGVPASIAAPNSTPSASTGASGTPGQVSVLRPGVDGSWSVLPAADGYVKADGTPVPVQTGPQMTPNGVVNYGNSDLLSAAASDAIAKGGNPLLVNKMLMDFQEKALAFDQKRGDLFKSIQEGNDAQQRVVESQARVKKDMLEMVGNTLHSDLSIPDPVARVSAVTNTLQLYPSVATHTLTALGADPRQLVGPNAPAYIQQFVQQNAPAVMKALTPYAAASPNYKQATELANATRTSLAGATASYASADASGASAASTRQTTTQSAADFAAKKTAAAGAAAQQVALVDPALKAINAVRNDQSLINNGLNTFLRQYAGSTPGSVGSGSDSSIVHGAITALIQKATGSAESPGTPANKLKTMMDPVVASLLEASTVAEKEEGATAPRNAAYIAEMKGIAGQLDNTKVYDPAVFNQALNQAERYLYNYKVAQQNNLGVLNATNPNGKQQGFVDVQPTVASAPKAVQLSEVKKAAEKQGVPLETFVHNLMVDGWQVH